MNSKRTFLYFSGAMLLMLTTLGSTRYSLLPGEEEKSLTIVTKCKDMPGEEVERVITNPLEKELLSMGEIKQSRSASAAGKSSITITFHKDVDMDRMYMTIRDRVERAASAFPSSVQRPAISRGGGEGTTIFIAFFDSRFGYSESSIKKLFSDLAPETDRKGRDSSRDLSGIGEIIVSGSEKPEIICGFSPGGIRDIDNPYNLISRSIQDRFRVRQIMLPRRGTPIIIDNRPETIQELDHWNIPGGPTIQSILSLSSGFAEKDSLARVNGEEVLTAFVTTSDPERIITLCGSLKRVLAGRDGVRIVYNRGGLMEKILLRNAVLFTTILSLLLLVLPFFQKDASGIMKRILFLPFVSAAALSGLALTGIPLTAINLPVAAVVIHQGAGCLENPDGTARQLLPGLLLWVPFFCYPDSFPAFLLHAGKTAIITTLGILLFFLLFRYTPPGIMKNELSSPSPWSCCAPTPGKSPRRNTILLLLINAALLCSIIPVFLKRPPQLWHIRLEEEGKVQLRMEFPEGTSAEYTSSRGRSVEKRLLQEPGLGMIISQYRREQGDLTIEMKNPKTGISLPDLIKRLSPRFPDIYFHDPDNSSDPEGIRVQLIGPDPEKLHNIVMDLGEKLINRPGVSSIIYNFKPAIPYLTIRFSPEICLHSGTSPLAAQRQLYTNLTSPIIARWISKEYTTKDIRLKQTQTVTPETLSSFPIQTPSGWIPLSNIAEFGSEERIKDIFHTNGLPSLGCTVYPVNKSNGYPIIELIEKELGIMKQKGIMGEEIFSEIGESAALREKPPYYPLLLLPPIILFSFSGILKRPGQAFATSLTVMAQIEFLLLLPLFFGLSGGGVILGMIFTGMKSLAECSRSKIAERGCLISSLAFPSMALPFIPSGGVLQTFFIVYLTGNAIYILLSLILNRHF